MIRLPCIHLGETWHLGYKRCGFRGRKIPLFFKILTDTLILENYTASKPEVLYPFYENSLKGYKVIKCILFIGHFGYG